ncbi:electron transfer flavoprotein alpha subunit apoprotein [Limimonas halophila]|uniref:Electron transfer flavoprotein subunit alpha n=1 Tax=Limimonas halophila TaxID=1082479 RepID=A0A1G7UGW0_9PROT|nr:FAD-binding protein [Limimonas halophila]SDG46737.1 electron transfer flavoprotein alpha subunit apoprotein [Limimonas halophila]
MSVLVIADHDGQQLTTGTRATLTAAKELNADRIDILVAGHDCRAVAEQAAQAAGVTTVFLADGESLAHKLAENMAPLVAEHGAKYDHVFAPASSTGKNVVGRAAALMDVQPVADITGVIGADTFRRPIYAGNAIATVQAGAGTKVITVRGTAFEGDALEGGGAAIEEVAAPGDQGLSSFVGQELSQSDRPELASARIVVSGGRGVGSGENFQLIERVADKMGAAVGASRAAVDAGFMPNDYQVGQTGKVVAPDLYIAVGISGAIQHLAGMKDSKYIAAINKDEEAPIFSVADYGLVADLFEAVPELEKELDNVQS